MKFQLSIIFFLWSCIGFIEKLESSIIEKRATTSVCNTPACAQAAQNILSFIDQTQNPCDDFYQFACRSFIEKTPLPADRTEYGIPEILAQNALEQIQEILLATDSSYTPEVNHAQNMYSKCISQENNVDQLKSVVQTLGGWSLVNATLNTQQVSLETLLAVLIKTTGTNSIIQATVDVDLTNSNSYILEADSAPVALNPNFIKSQASKNAYFNHIKTCAQGLGASSSINVNAQINQIIQFNNQLAKIVPTEGEAINFTLIYKKLTISELQQLTDPNTEVFDWLKFYSTLTSLELTSSEPIGVYNLKYLTQVLKLVKSTNKNTVINYIMWCFVERFAWTAGGQLLTSTLSIVNTLNGVSKSVPMNTTCTEFVNYFWGLALAKPYLAKAFPSDSQQEALQVIQSTLNTFNTIISTGISYLTGNVKATALQKLAQLRVLVGYPTWVNNDTAVHEYFADYPPMTSTHLLNSLNAYESQVQQQLKLLRQPVDKTQFETLPSDVNPVNDLSFNSISFPAALLQQPFFGVGQPEYLNFGKLGVLTGTELNKGLDFVGGQFDANGNLNQWWTEFVIESVNKDVACVTEQYSQYCSTTQPKQCVTGSATAIQHIGDFDGILGAYYTYKSWVSKNGQEPQLPGLTNYTAEQMLFISFAQQYCTATVPGNIVQIYQYDEQLYNRARVNGLLSDVSQFATEFNCPLGPMNRGNQSCVPY